MPQDAVTDVLDRGISLRVVAVDHWVFYVTHIWDGI